MGPWEKIDRIVDFYAEKIISNNKFHNIITQHFPTIQSPETKNLITKMKLRNLDEIRKTILDGQKKKIFRKVDIEFTVGSVMGTFSQLTMSKIFLLQPFEH